jgi:hypothetical protein
VTRIHGTPSGGNRRHTAFAISPHPVLQENPMSRLLFIILSMFSAFALAGMPVAVQPTQLLLAMGPDPGGHTGAGVTPETTKTDRPGVDAARQSASGGKVESNTPSDSTQSRPANKKDKPAN